MTDERLLTAAKLYEQSHGRIEGNSSLYEHAGLPLDPAVRSDLSFIAESLRTAGDEHGLGTSLTETKLGNVLDGKFRTEAATKSIESDDATALSYLVGVTEKDLDASALTLPFRLVGRIDNGGAPAFISAAGNPNTGKTNSMFVIVDLAKEYYDDPLVVTNVRNADITDICVTSAHDLTVALLENRQRDLIVILDEGSTHFDARTKSYEVASQWTPLAKRMAKIGVVMCGVIVHTGKDLHPEQKRLTTTSFYKTEKDEIEFYENWHPEDDTPSDQLFGGSLQSLEPHGDWYDPDDAAPWHWNLSADLFNTDLDWSKLLVELKQHGPSE